ncbi:MAG: NAD(P)-dependent oxidoreductase, partial [Bacillota bacterium]
MFGLYDQLKNLDEKGTPIRIGFVGAGAMGINFIGQTVMAPGMAPQIVVDIKIENCIKAWKQSNIPERDIVVCDTLEDAQKAIKDNKKVCSTNFDIIVNNKDIDVVVEGTGNPEVGTNYAFRTIMNKKHFVTLSVEMDVVVGYILKRLADNAGVTYTGIYGDEPGVIKLLYDTVKSLGFEVIAAGRGDTGNSDLKWNPQTVLPLLEGRSKKRGFDPKKMTVNPYMFASFNDGSKTNEELTMVANATGLVPDVRGTHSPMIEYNEFSVKVPKVFDLKERGGLLNQYGVVESTGIPGGV